MPDRIVTNQALQNYRNGIRAATRAHWKGFTDSDQFFEQMFAAINLGIPASWNEGAKEVGVMPNELTPQERLAQRRMISDELMRVDGFGQFVDANSQANKGKLATVMARADSWILRAQDAKNRGVLSGRNDPKLIWSIDMSKDNCSSCLSLDKKVKRASMWKRLEILPQNPINEKLVCKGFKCGCTLTPTDLPLSRGRLPNLP